LFINFSPIIKIIVAVNPLEVDNQPELKINREIPEIPENGTSKLWKTKRFLI